MQTKRLWRVLASFSAVAASVLTIGTLIPTIARADSPTLKITEINWAGSPHNAQDQWIELKNVSPSAIAFATTPFTVEAEINGSSQTLATLDSSDGVLAAGDYLVLQRESSADSTLVNSSTGAKYIEDSSLVLPTSATVYEVKQDTTIVDQVGDINGTVPFAGAAGAIPASMSKTDPNADSSSQSSWYTARTIGANFDTGVVQYGTPGAENADIAAPTAVTITPTSTTVAGTNITVIGQTDGNATNAEVDFTKTSFVPTPTVYSFTGAVAGDDSFSISTTTLPAGRYSVTTFTSDANGNRSQSTAVVDNFVVTPLTSSVPAPTVPNVPTLTNALTITVSGTVDTNGHDYHSVEILRNNQYLMTVPVMNGAFTADIALLANTANDLQFFAVDTTGAFSLPATATVTNDNIPPAAVDASKVIVNANPAGTNDSLFGQPGAAEANSTVYVYTDAARTQLLAVVPVNADGSFGLVNLGDNLYIKLYLVDQDAAGNRSAATTVSNDTGFVGGSVATIDPTITATTGTQVSFSWSAVSGAVSYHVKYRLANGSYGKAITFCDGGNSNCSFTATISGLVPGSDYTLAIAAVDTFGNESQYTEKSFNSGSVPAPTITTTAFTGVGSNPATTTAVNNAPTTSSGISTSRGTDHITEVTTPTPTPAPSASPSPEQGQVKSATTEATRNWTPWIILGVLLGIAILATAGYFYWFGGEAGEAAMADIAADRANHETATKPKRTTTTRGRGRPATRKKTPREKRW